MKIKALILTLLVATAAFAAQDSVNLTHKYKVGDKDSYTMTMKMDIGVGDISVTGDMTMSVLKVYDNGDADIETKTGEMMVNAMGREQKAPASPASTQRVNKFGQPVEASKNKSNMPFTMLGGMFGDGNLKIGEVKNIDQADPANPKNKVKGTIKVESVTEGVAKIVSSFDMTSEGSDKPMHFDTTTWVSTDNGRLQKMEGKGSGGAGGQGEIKSMIFTMEHKK